jgi:hypothetical protein
MIVVGGYLADSAQWQLLENGWMPKIKKHGLKEFKRSTYNVKKFGHDFLLELVGLIQQHAICGFACGIDCNDWRKVAARYAMELFYLMPFSLCARTCVAIVRDWCRTNRVRQDYMAYIFDKGSQDYGQFTLLLENDMSPQVRGVTPIREDSMRIAALQCADFLSWEARNQFLKDPNPASVDQLTPELAGLLRGRFLSLDSSAKIFRFGVYREKDIEGVCKASKIPLLKDVPSAIWARPKPIRLTLPTSLGDPPRRKK